MTRIPGMFAILAITSGILAGSVQGQEKKKGPPQPTAITLETKDGVILKTTFFPGSRGKKSVPIIMLHGYQRQRADLAALALGLQRLGHAVILPDLRGHGRSTTIKTVRGDMTIELDRMTKAAFQIGMVNDVQACKKFLVERHNKGELNIELLCVLGCEMGAMVALNWAAYDWSAPQLPAYKQGRDVKALVLLSPPASFKGATARAATKLPVIRSDVSMLIAAGKRDRKSYSEAKRLYSSLERYRKKYKTEQERVENQSLFLVEPDADLVGAELIKAAGLNVGRDIAQFINLRLVAKEKDIPWVFRKRPLSDDTETDN